MGAQTGGINVERAVAELNVLLVKLRQERMGLWRIMNEHPNGGSKTFGLVLIADVKRLYGSL